ncbi:replication restart helicase PriA [Desulforhopalus singaporensis]|uniref:Replication restart protein PriA n=1 Tax=Desulforhopalus singaporensis TaxID=91360 RepID=A0A1H0PFE7_9BACT|nr:primosomal protein N' [Desulforhopalus singaporensis]SDP03405.1 replication restart DNA helicase PriA [Desulforhopalus singaporensis]
MTYLEVALAVPLDTVLTYSCPDDLAVVPVAGEVFSLVGRRVLVPLGGRQVTGYVVDDMVETEGELPFRIKPINRFLDDRAVFDESMVRFFRWAADYYQYPLGLVIKAALPGGMTQQSVTRIVLKASSVEFLERFGDKVPPWADQLVAKKTLSARESRKILTTSRWKKTIAELADSGVVEIANSVAKDRVSAKKEKCYELAPLGTNVLDRFENFAVCAEQIALCIKTTELTCGMVLKKSEAKTLLVIGGLANEKQTLRISHKEVLDLYPNARTRIVELIDKQLIYESQHRIYRSPLGEQLRYYPRPEELTSQQEAVVTEIAAAIGTTKFAPFLLHGVTGSGKTEVYLRSAERTLELGRDVIVLVPEIALATQLEAHFVSRFGDNVALLHSGMSSAEKYDQFFMALNGRAKIVIGARSAIFAPLTKPGLIIVDEEHDSSYKQDDGFCYHARDLAVLRAKHSDCTVILGSATPSVTSYYNTRIGKYRLLEMSKRVGSSSLPRTALLNLNSKNRIRKKTIISQELLQMMQDTMADEKQVILLLNRRGFATALVCRDCGTPVSCNHCNISLTYHKQRESMMCHYCGFTQSASLVCGQCRSMDLQPVGFGTERVENELAELLPDARIKRIDSDIAADRKKFITILSQMHNGDIDILIGTQMIAKGHHFPKVTLVGVLWADGGMSMPDYKAAERTFQLITQVTGRAGREEAPGRVLIQTMRPDHYAIEYAKSHDYEKFYNHEIELRKNPFFPPFVRLVLLRIQGRVESSVRTTCLDVARFCRKFAADSKNRMEILGPAPAPLDRVRDNFRWQILLKSPSPHHLHQLCQRLRESSRQLVNSQCNLVIDVDPESMM